MRRNNKKSQETPTVDGDERMDCRLHKRMHNLSAKQDPYSSEEDTPIPNNDQTRDTSIQASGHGPHHRPSEA
jgi:hypothetical protein